MNAGPAGSPHDGLEPAQVARHLTDYHYAPDERAQMRAELDGVRAEQVSALRAATDNVPSDQAARAILVHERAHQTNTTNGA